MDVILAKIISLTCLLVLSFSFGTLPYLILLRRTESQTLTQRRETIIKFFNCFAGGVFLGALFLDLIVEGSEEFEKYKEAIEYKNDFPFFNVIVITGFFMVSAIEHFAHSLFSKRQDSSSRQKTVTVKKEEDSQNLQHANSRTYGSMAEPTIIVSQPEHPSNGRLHSNSQEHDLKKSESKAEIGHVGGMCDKEERDLLMNGVASTPPTTNSAVKTLKLKSFLLLLALSFHSIFDGLALGLQDTESQVWQIFLAVGLHKSVVSFCLGLDIFGNSSQPKTAAAWIAIFSMISPVGACIGITLTSTGIDEVPKLLSSSILQGLACGAFLYVTFMEILNSSWKGHNQRSFLSIIFAFMGFTIMAIVKTLD